MALSPFSEDARFEQNQTGSFYMTGSAGSVGEDPGTFSGPLRNKVQVRLSFEVKNPVKMLPNSSSIYYFDVRNGQWKLPDGAVSDHVGPFDNFSIEPTPPAEGSALVEDAKGFNAYGQPIASGSLDVIRVSEGYNNTIDLIGQPIADKTPLELVDYMTRNYPKSIQRASAYKANANELFSVTDAPFLIEKAVFEIPFGFGDTWFDDRTFTCFSSGTLSIGDTDTYFDMGGPAITLSVFCQKNYGTSSIRDLILTGVITHKEDTAVSFSKRSLLTAGGRQYRVFEKMGIPNVASEVLRPASLPVTSSFIVKTQASISNGVSGIGREAYTIGGANISPEKYLERVNFLLSEPEISKSDLIKQGSVVSLITSIDAFGRGMSGFDPSGGSIFGGEYVTPKFGEVLSNPYYVADETLRSSSFSLFSSSISSIINSGAPAAEAIFAHVVPFSFFTSQKESPYLLYPGDKIFLAMSKTRRAITDSLHVQTDASTGENITYGMTPRTGSTDGHDVTLESGQINITLYGSYVKAGDAYNP